ncbi:MAG: TlpA family protein disulfide reductase [Deltaproteobacteria bacterium]
MRIFGRAVVFPILGVAILLAGPGAAFSQDKPMTPLSGGIPMIEGIKMLEVGAAAPDFSIKDTAGNLFNLAAAKGKKPILIIFWSIFCEPCRAEMPAIQRMHEKYGDKGLEVISIALDGEPLKSSIVGFAKQEGYSFRVLIDELDSKEMFKVADPYGVGGTPTTFLLDRGGKVALAKAGIVKEDELEKAIGKILKK